MNSKGAATDDWRRALIADHSLLPNARLLGLALSLDSAHPSQKVLAAATGIARSSVSRLVPTLIEAGWIEQIGESSGGRCNRYRVVPRAARRLPTSLHFGAQERWLTPSASDAAS